MGSQHSFHRFHYFNFLLRSQMENSHSRITTISSWSNCHCFHCNFVCYFIQQIRNGNSSSSFYPYRNACNCRYWTVFICFQVCIGYVLHNRFDDPFCRSHHIQQFLQTSLRCHRVVKHHVLYELFTCSIHLDNQSFPNHGLDQEKT